MRKRGGLIATAILLVLLLFVPQIAPRIHLAISVCTEVLLFAMAAMAVNLLIGYTGVLPFGNAAFFGLGAYGAGLTIEYWHAGFLSSIGLGVLASLIGALAIGPFLLRRRGIYFALLMIAFGQVFYFIAYRFTDITGGEDGMNFSRPAVEWLGWQLKDENFYYAMLAFFVVVGIVFYILVRSPFGRSLLAIKENETRARYLGLNTDRFIFIALLISAAIEGLAGACYGLSIMFAYPLMLDWHNSGNIVLMTILGGSGTILGPFLGALIFVIGNDILSTAVPWWQIPLGALFVVCVLGFPKGIVGTFLDLVERRRSGFSYEAREPEFQSTSLPKGETTP
ncbi:MAG TPA: branched-chain amino acid ABC transporter permease [Candidatus Acidoferrales bacterium]|nr:branched-chain amino acid ABC transporter permease [Candidatus Acidoferrales bacterium]